MNVIAKISCYFERSVVTLKLRKEYLNTVTYNIPVLFRIKYWTVRCIERYSMSTYTGVSNFKNTVRFFWPTLYMGLVAWNKKTMEREWCTQLSTCYTFQFSHKTGQTMPLYDYLTPKLHFKRKFNHRQSFLYKGRLTVRTIRKFRIGSSLRIKSRIGSSIRNRIESRSFAGPYAKRNPST